MHTFNTIKKLSNYNYSQNKIYKKNQLESKVMLRHLLRKLSAIRKRA